MTVNSISPYSKWGSPQQLSPYFQDRLLGGALPPPTSDFLLQENGDLILQADGGRILINVPIPSI